jgi:hypothetical protein
MPIAETVMPLKNNAKKINLALLKSSSSLKTKYKTIKGIMKSPNLCHAACLSYANKTEKICHPKNNHKKILPR